MLIWSTCHRVNLHSSLNAAIIKIIMSAIDASLQFFFHRCSHTSQPSCQPSSAPSCQHQHPHQHQHNQSSVGSSRWLHSRRNEGWLTGHISQSKWPRSANTTTVMVKLVLSLLLLVIILMMIYTSTNIMMIFYLLVQYYKNYILIFLCYSSYY